MAISNLSPGEYNRFAQSIKFVLKHEGRYVNDPNDAGGETKFGISKKSYPTLDIKNLTSEQACDIYYNDYWVPSKSATLPYPECVAVFDTAVNNGLGKVKSWWSMNPFDVDTFLTNRTMFYIQLVKQKPADQIYLKGWLARVQDLKKLIETDHQNNPIPPVQSLYLGQ